MDKTQQTPKIAAGAITEAKPGKRTGRPKTRPDSRQASFHIPVELLDKIDAEADAICAGNKSFLIIKMIEKYFKNKELK